MIKIKCEGCNNKCCQDPLTPVLLASEEKKFRRYSRAIETPYRRMMVLKKDKERCIFLKNKRCSIYEKRPLECVLYPFLLDFKDKIDVKLDKRFCPHLNTLKFDKKKILGLVRKNDFPVDWIKGYDALTDF